MSYNEALSQIVKPIVGIGYRQSPGAYFLEANAFPGDFGYIKDSSSTFVCLGHTSQYADVDGEPSHIFTWGLPGQGTEIEDELASRTWPTGVERCVPKHAVCVPAKT